MKSEIKKYLELGGNEILLNCCLLDDPLLSSQTNFRVGNALFFF